MGVYTQSARHMELSAAGLPPESVLLVGLSGQESVSQLFRFQLDALVENKTPVDFGRLLGKPLGVRLDLPGGGRRLFNGVCCRVEQGEIDTDFSVFRLEMVPAFWLWTQRVESRIFQHQSVPDILKEVLKGLKAEFHLQGKYPPRAFCVQYRESDFHFASRLMEEEGIFYFFRHEASGHTLIVGDNPRAHPDL